MCSFDSLIIPSKTGDLEPSGFLPMGHNIGHIIDGEVIHADANKMTAISTWPVPQNVHNIQPFLGLAQYLAVYMPDLSAYIRLISDLTHKGRAFLWTPVHDCCFESIEMLASRAPILHPMNVGWGN